MKPMGEEEEYFPDDGKMPPEKPKIEREGRKKNFVEKFTEIKASAIYWRCTYLLLTYIFTAIW